MMEGNKCPRCGSYDLKAVNKPMLGEPTEWICGICFNHWNYDKRDYTPKKLPTPPKEEGECAMCGGMGEIMYKPSPDQTGYEVCSCQKQNPTPPKEEDE